MKTIFGQTKVESLLYYINEILREFEK